MIKALDLSVSMLELDLYGFPKTGVMSLKFIIIKRFKNRDELCKFLERSNTKSSFGIFRLIAFIFASILVERMFPGSEFVKNIVIVALGLAIFVTFPKLGGKGT